MVKNFVCVVLYRPQEYQGIDVKNPYFLQEIIHIIAFLNEAACNSSTSELLRANAEFFCVEIGIIFSLTSTPYNPHGWYKSLWRFMSSPLYKLDIIKNYIHLPLLCKKDADLKVLNFLRNFIQAIALADITTVDTNRISH